MKTYKTGSRRFEKKADSCGDMWVPAHVAQGLYDALQDTAEKLDLVMKSNGYTKTTQQSALKEARTALAAADGEDQQKCNCSMRTKLVGDGCRTCNPGRFEYLDSEEE